MIGCVLCPDIESSHCADYKWRASRWLKCKKRLVFSYTFSLKKGIAHIETHTQTHRLYARIFGVPTGFVALESESFTPLYSSAAAYMRERERERCRGVLPVHNMLNELRAVVPPPPRYAGFKYIYIYMKWCCALWWVCVCVCLSWVYCSGCLASIWQYGMLCASSTGTC